MKLASLDTVLWLASFVMELVLLVVLVGRGRWRQFPVFATWIAFEASLSVAMYWLYVRDLGVWYSRVYWFGLWPEFALELGVIFEIARIVLRPTGTWVRDARGFFFTAALGGGAVAALLSWWITPAHSGYSAWDLRGNLFTSLVVCEIFAAMSMTANRLGLGWRNHVMALGQGLTAWSSVMVLTTALQSYFGHQYYHDFSRARIFVYLGAMAWIAVQLWRPEPERQPISEELQKYILALHRRVEYDLQRFDAGD